MYPDYDFSQLRAQHFEKELNVMLVEEAVDSHLLEVSKVGFWRLPRHEDIQTTVSLYPSRKDEPQSNVMKPSWGSPATHEEWLLFAPSNNQLWNTMLARSMLLVMSRDKNTSMQHSMVGKLLASRLSSSFFWDRSMCLSRLGGTCTEPLEIFFSGLGAKSRWWRCVILRHSLGSPRWGRQTTSRYFRVLSADLLLHGVMTQALLMQAVNLQNCDVYSYKGDGEMDPLSTLLSLLRWHHLQQHKKRGKRQCFLNIRSWSHMH